MESVLKIGADITTPLMLAGFISAAFFLIVRMLVKKISFSELSGGAVSQFAHKLVDKFFVLAIAGMVMGFWGFAIEVKSRNVPANNLEEKIDALVNELNAQSVRPPKSNSKCNLRVDAEVIAEFTEIVRLIATLNQLDCGERNYWLSVMPVATDQQADRLFTILTDEVNRNEEAALK
ncbi:hypothetical protein FLL98_19385 [Vibrio cholerae]|uniref:hypothetical protein n=1 Tax=Vibrio cholerae TaxID=666 RepID=UPI00115B8E9D|nr:hypothetical protein [Vibrio cholerae]TQP49032.1 hypothetical protein FLL98_19385 [Vibrio cholerae]